MTAFLKMARSQTIAPQVGKLSRSALFSKKGLYKRKHAAPAAAPGESPLLLHDPHAGRV